MYHGLPGDDPDDSPVELVMWNRPLNSRPGPNSTGPPPVPDPWYFELKGEIEGMCLVAVSWIECVGNHIYTRQLREDVEELNMKMTIFLTSLEYPVPESEVPQCNDLGNPYSTKEEYWEHLKDEYQYLSNMFDTMRQPPKRVRRTQFGDESPPLESQTIGSSSQRAPTSAPPPVSVEAEDTDGHQNTDEAVDDHHAQPHQGRGA